MSWFKGLQISLLVVLVVVMGLMLGCAKKPVMVKYVLTGKIVVINDCDKKQGSIPAKVKVKAWLNSTTPQNQIGGSQNVNLVPDPAAPNAPKKIGTYSISVPWTGMPGKPSTWDQPTIEVNGREVCSDNRNCIEGKCVDVATTDKIQFKDPTTNHDIQVHCECKK